MTSEEIVKKVLEASSAQGLNPVQDLAVKSGLFGRRNMVLAAPTASGKTLVAEMASLKTILLNHKKVVYIVPLRALANEKYEEFRKKYEPLGIKVGMSIGDYDKSDSWLAKYDLIIVTSEKMDSLLRHGISWTDSIGLVVADEIHLLDSPDRGPTLEIVLTRLMHTTNPEILGLSATINNYEELAGWLKAEPVKSDYRPVKLYVGVCYDSKVDFLPKKEITLNPDETAIKELVNDTLKRKKQALIFISTRKNAESAAEKLGELVKTHLTKDDMQNLSELSEKILNVLDHPTKQCERLAGCVKSGTAFHHAGLTNQQRFLVENAFKEGIIKILAATPTLAAGINLPAWRVIIRDLKRYSRFGGMDYIPVLEIHQMCVPGNSEILMEDGSYKQIESIIKNKTNLLSFSVYKKTFESCKIKKGFRRYASEFIKIKTSGKEIELTPEHPVLTWNKKPIWLPAKHIKRGSKIGVVGELKINKKLPLFIDYLDDQIYIKNINAIRSIRTLSGKGYKDFSKVLSIPYKTAKAYAYNKAIPLKHILKLSEILGISKDKVAELLDGSNFKSKYGMTIKLPKCLNQDFLWLVGLVAADGHISDYVNVRGKWSNVKYSKLKIASINSNIIRKIQGICNDFGMKCYKRKHRSGFRPDRTSWELEITNQALITILKNFGIPSGEKTKIMRFNKIFHLPNTLISAFLAGFFDGDGNVQQNMSGVRLGSISKDVINDTQKLLIRLGIRSSICKEHNSYTISVNRKEDINKFFELIPCVRLKGGKLSYKRVTRPAISFGDVHFESVKSIEETKYKKPIPVYNLSVENNENFVCNNFIIHNCGRAGRPKWDTEGQAILMAKSESEAKHLWEYYIKGEPEKIYSKLGIEPVLRMHVLALIASGTTPTKQSLLDFFSKTFYAHQYKDLSELEKILNKVISLLRDINFIQSPGDSPFRKASESQDELRPTKIGRRVSELYIDPLTAHHLIKDMKLAEERGTNTFGVMHMISSTVEMFPLLGIRKADMQKINELLADYEPFLMEKPPNPWDIEYDDYIRSIKTAWFFSEWAEEAGEDAILDYFGVTPGELRVRLSNADWLLYSSHELALLLDLKNTLKEIRKTRLRIKYGIREELLALVALKGVGRVRARTLYNHGLKKLDDLRKIPLESLERILGPKIAREIKEQL